MRVLNLVRNTDPHQTVSLPDRTARQRIRKRLSKEVDRLPLFISFLGLGLHRAVQWHNIINLPKTNASAGAQGRATQMRTGEKCIYFKRFYSMYGLFGLMDGNKNQLIFLPFNH